MLVDVLDLALGWYPGKVEALKAEGKWPVPRVPGYSLVELKENRDFLTRTLAQQVRQVRALGKRFETSATRIDAVVEAVRAAGIDVPLPMTTSNAASMEILITVLVVQLALSVLTC